MAEKKFNKIMLGIACPMANERDNAIAFVEAVLKVSRPFHFRQMKFFAIFDRVCTDGTYDLLCQYAQKVPELEVVYAEENRCVVDAYMRGYREALAAGSDWILEIDAGFSHHPEDIPRFFEKMAEGYDCVFGSRFCPGARYEETSLKRRLLSRGGTWLNNVLVGTRLNDMASGFELFSSEALTAILQKGVRSRGPFFQTEIRTFAHALNIVELPIQYGAASHSMRMREIRDAFAGLGRLFHLRIKGELYNGLPQKV
jgi:dolichol-phosphate mannosyltransferase